MSIQKKPLYPEKAAPKSAKKEAVKKPKKKPVKKKATGVVKKKTTTKQVVLAKHNKPGGNNPTGKGGFQERPQDRNDGRWLAKDSYSYWLQKLERMSVANFALFEHEHPIDEMTMAMKLAYEHTKAAQKDIQFAKERNDRTAGKAPQTIQMDVNDPSAPYKELTTEELRKLAADDSKN